jgi:hypothetical protein
VRRYSGLVGSVIAGCLVAGCSALPGLSSGAEPAPSTPAPSATATPAPGLSEQEATAIIKDYIDRNNVANKARSDKLLAEYEGGSSLAIDKAAYSSSRILHKSTEYQPFGYTKPTFYPSAGGERPWLLILAHWQRKKDIAKEATYLLFAREGDAWRQVYSPDTFDGTSPEELPAIAKDASGAATEVGQDDTGLVMSPADFAANYAAHLAGKGAKAAKTGFAADRLATNAAAKRREMTKFARVSEVARTTRYPSYAVRTSDGGALAFTTLQRTRRYDVRQGPEKYYVFQKDSGLLRGKYSTYMKATDLVQVVAHIPPKGAEPAQIKVLGSYSGLVAGSGR